MPVGHLEVITGSMFSGKTEELIRRTRRALIARRRVLMVKPAIDDRYGAEAVFTHDGRSAEAVPLAVSEAERIFVMANEHGAEVVSIDEVQFFDGDVVGVVGRLVASGRRVLVSGLDLDFARRPFGCMPALMAMADDVQKLKAICVRCGEPAMFTQRLIDGRPATASDPLVVIGGAEAYEARCRRCHEVAPAQPNGGANGAAAASEAAGRTALDAPTVAANSEGGHGQ